MRQFRLALSLLAVLAVLLLLAACGGAPAAPAAQEEAAPAEAAPAEAAAPAEGAAEGMPADSIPYPDPPELDLGGTMVERMPIEEMVAYKALPEYNEPEWVTALVEEGKLPPVAVHTDGPLKDPAGVYVHVPAAPDPFRTEQLKVLFDKYAGPTPVYLKIGTSEYRTIKTRFRMAVNPESKYQIEKITGANSLVVVK